MEKLFSSLEDEGSFLVVENKEGAINVMTIGWAQVGIVWGRRIMSVFIRPSRYTHSLIERAEYFSVCVPPKGKMRRELSFCGSRSARDLNKVKECGFVLENGCRKGIKFIKGSALVYECRIVSRSRIFKEETDKGIKRDYYPGNDYHSVYYGEIINIKEGNP